MRQSSFLSAISWSGRAPRKTFWTYVGLFALVTILAVVMVGGTRVTSASGTSGKIWLWLTYLAWIPLIGAQVRRLHDADYSAWWLLPFTAFPLLLVYVGKILRNLDADKTADLGFFLWSGLLMWGFIRMGFLRGTAGPNRYGSDPLARPATIVDGSIPIALVEAAGAPAKTRSNTKWAFISVGAALLLVVLSTALETWLQVKSMSPEMRDRIVGCARAQRFAKAKLKSPETAQFPACLPQMFALKIAADEWIARGFFVEDVAGKKTRSIYVVKMRHTTGTKDWSPIIVSIRAWPQRTRAAPRFEPQNTARNT